MRSGCTDAACIRDIEADFQATLAQCRTVENDPPGASGRVKSSASGGHSAQVHRPADLNEKRPGNAVKRFRGVLCLCFCACRHSSLFQRGGHRLQRVTHHMMIHLLVTVQHHVVLKICMDVLYLLLPHCVRDTALCIPVPAPGQDRSRILRFEGRAVNVGRSSPRAISTGQLHTLLHFHLRPINQIVFLGPYSLRMGDLILGGVSRLDAFSVYLVRT